PSGWCWSGAVGNCSPISIGGRAEPSAAADGRRRVGFLGFRLTRAAAAAERGRSADLNSALRHGACMPSSITRYLDLLDQQREAIFDELGPLSDAVLWYRPGSRVWSIGEHLDHTRVLSCAVRRLLIVYFPLASTFARLFRHRPYEADIDDVYKR